MNYKTISIVIVCLVLHWLFSHSFYGIKMKQLQLKNDFLKSLLVDAGILSPNKRVLDFLFDLCLIDFAFKSEMIFQVGLGQCIQANLRFISSLLTTISPLNQTPLCPEFLKVVISIFIVVYPFVLIEIMGPKSRIEFSNNKYNIIIIPIVIIFNYILFAFVAWVFTFIYSLIKIGWLMYSIGAFALIMIFTIYVAIASDFRD